MPTKPHILKLLIYVKIKDTNLHCMNKQCLQDPEIRGLLEEYSKR